MYLENERQILLWRFVILSAGAGGNGICIDCVAACDNRFYEALITLKISMPTFMTPVQSAGRPPLGFDQLWMFPKCRTSHSVAMRA
jgi:hypothetical protein